MGQEMDRHEKGVEAASEGPGGGVMEVMGEGEGCDRRQSLVLTLSLR